MQLGMIGLGRMGANMVRRLLKAAMWRPLLFGCARRRLDLLSVSLACSYIDSCWKWTSPVDSDLVVRTATRHRS
jgi:hypothetical protein